jgi:hypothetical protein
MKKEKKDFIKEYKQRKLIWNLWILALSLVLALWINFYLLDSTETWRNLKASILDINPAEDRADLYLENTWNQLVMKTPNIFQNPTSLSISLIYNPLVLEIQSITSSFWEVAILWEQNVWSDTILLTMNWTRDIYAWDVIFEVNYNKKEQSSTQLNIVNANFEDIGNDRYELSTEGITF